VKIVFRPEDVSLSKSEFVKPAHQRISAAIVEEISFVGAYERVRLRLEKNGLDQCATDDQFFLTTDTPESQSVKSIIATRPKPEASTTRLRVGERVIVSITAFSVLAPEPERRAKRSIDLEQTN
jgi:hypothetical protein